MKKIIVVLTSILMMISISSCANNNTTVNQDDKLQIVTTIFPLYDWTQNIIGDNPSDIEVTMLLDNGVDLHSYQPTAEDMVKIATCDIFIYIGGESDEWVEDALKEATNEKMIVLNMLQLLGEDAKEEERKEGMEEEEHEHEHEHEEEYDEHVWLSLSNAKKLCNEIELAIEKIDSNNSKLYQDNLKAYTDSISKLDKEFQETISSSKQNVLLFGDRFPFRYFVDDYGLDYYAAFAGCSAETEASFETIVFLSQKVDELKLNNVMTIEGTNHKIAETIIQNTKDKNQNILVLDSMQSITAEDIQKGISYLSIMEKNLQVIKDALN